MTDLSNVSNLRYGFDLDRSCFIDIAMYVQVILSILNTFVFHPFPLFILLRKSRTMSSSIRRGYIAMHVAFIAYEIFFFFLARIYVIMPYSGLYCEGPICRMELPRRVLLGIISFSIVMLQPPFAFLILRMHQMFMEEGSPFKLSKRTQIGMACVQLPLLSMNVVGFVIFGTEPDNIESLLEEPELAYLETRGGQLLIFGGPGSPQFFRWELILFFISLAANFSVLLFCILHTMHCLKKASLVAKSPHTQHLAKKLFEVFFWQLHGSVVNHVIPLTAVMAFMCIDTSNFPGVLSAVIRLTLLISFTLNSTQFCVIFILKNSVNRQMMIGFFLSIIRSVTNSKAAPVEPRRNEREFSLSMTIM